MGIEWKKSENVERLLACLYASVAERGMKVPTLASSYPQSLRLPLSLAVLASQPPYMLYIFTDKNHRLTTTASLTSSAAKPLTGPSSTAFAAFVLRPTDLSELAPAPPPTAPTVSAMPSLLPGLSKREVHQRHRSSLKGRGRSRKTMVLPLVMLALHSMTLIE